MADTFLMSKGTKQAWGEEENIDRVHYEEDYILLTSKKDYILFMRNINS
jgi:hypothetical protein